MEDIESMDLAVECLDGTEGFFTEVGKQFLTFAKMLFRIEDKFQISWKKSYCIWETFAFSRFSLANLK